MFDRKKNYSDDKEGQSSGGPRKKYQGRSKAAPEPRSSSGGGNDEDFQHVTTLFPSKSGKAYSVFLRPENVEVMLQAEEGDLLCITQTNDGEKLNLSFKKADQ